MGTSSRTWYCRPKSERSQDDLYWRKEIETVLEEYPCYGYIRVTKELQRRGFSVNKKKTQRLMKTFKLLQKKRKKKMYTTDSNHGLAVYPNLIKDIVPCHPNHIWVSDITYIHLGVGFCYLAVVLDIFTRNVKGWALMKTMESILTVSALEMALKKGSPSYHHSDRGSQYCAEDYIWILKDNKIKISMSRKGEPTDNPYAESFMKTFKVEEVAMFEYDDFEDAKRSIRKFIEVVYAKKRLHSSLGYMPPEEFEIEWRKNNKSQNKNQDKTKGRKHSLIPIQKTEKNKIFAVS
jgi:putative transposase